MWRKIIKSLKDFFIPSLQNELWPYSLRYKTLAFLAVFSLVVEILLYLYINVAFRANPFLSTANNTASVISSIQSTVADLLPEAIVNATNQARTLNGETPLTFSPSLSRAAALKAEDMLARGYFSHFDPAGQEPWIWFDKVNYLYQYAGENLGMNFYDTNALVNSWLKSPEHRQNLLDDHFQEIGVGIAQGLYKGKQTTLVVQFFASQVALEELPSYAVEKPLPNIAALPPPVVPSDPPEEPKPPKQPLAVSTATIAVAAATTTVIADPTATTAVALAEPAPAEPKLLTGSEPAASVGMVRQALVSPRYFIQDVMTVLLCYIFLTLLVPMIVIFLNHRSPDYRLRIREILMLFRRSIISSSITVFFIILILIINFAILQSNLKLTIGEQQLGIIITNQL